MLRIEGVLRRLSIRARLLLLTSSLLAMLICTNLFLRETIDGSLTLTAAVVGLGGLLSMLVLRRVCEALEWINRGDLDVVLPARTATRSTP